MIAGHPRLTLHLGVEVGRDVTREALMAGHHAIVHAVGAATDRRLEIPGAELPGVVPATELVAWYNGHPDHADRTVDLSHPRVVIVGNGNVALDLARILTTDPDALRDTEIAPAALRALRASRVEEVVVLARRGPEHSAFTLPELVGLQATPGVALGVVPAELAEAPEGDPKVERLRGLPAAAPGGRRVTLRYGVTPARVVAGPTGAAAALEVTRPDGSTETIAAGLVLSSIGYRGVAIPTLPFDADSGTVPNDAGRVVDPATGAPVPGAYVVGWIKRGPRGFIGTNRLCAQETVATLVADANADRLASPTQALPAPPATFAARARRALAGRR